MPNKQQLFIWFNMIDLPENLSLPSEVPRGVVERCVVDASRYLHLDPFIVMAIIKVEGGKVGTLSKNSNGSYDMGVMQINTIHLGDIEQKHPGITWRDATYRPCINIALGTSLLKQRIDEVKGDVWRGVGNYHSKTPKYHNRYKEKVKKEYAKLLDTYKARGRGVGSPVANGI